MKITLPEPVTCQRCQYQWRPRVAEVRMCPRCKSTKWETPKKRRAVAVSAALALAVSLSSCALFQRPSAVIERNYADDSRTRRVKLGSDLNVWPLLSETEAHARERVLAEIAAECPRYQLLAEGTDQQQRVSTWDDEVSTNTDRYVWVRYRCRK